MSVDLSENLQQEIHNELVATNQLLQLISHELHQIKQMTCPGGEFEANIANNAVLARTLANLQQIDVDKLPPVTRIARKDNTNQSTMDESP